MIRAVDVSVTTGTAGAGTAISNRPINGEVRGIYYPGTAFPGTAHCTVGLASQAIGTVVPTNAFYHGPGTAVFGPGSTVSRYKSFPCVPGEHLRVIVRGVVSKTDTVRIVYADV